MSANPHANGGKVLVDLDIPNFRDYALDVDMKRPATTRAESVRQLGNLLRDVYVRNAEPANFRLFCPDETNSNRLGNVFEVENRCFVGPTLDIRDGVGVDDGAAHQVAPGSGEPPLAGADRVAQHLADVNLLA
jgi:xylulose-5-phosphate/fructose-6-phosphate phosphoketolase